MVEIEKIGNCSKCGRDAAWNTPCIDSKGRLYCQDCSYLQGKLLKGIEQFMKNGKYIPDGTLVHGPCIVRASPWGTWAYLDKGQECFFLHPKEKAESPRAIMSILRKYHKAGWHRCSSCGKDLKSEAEIAGRPLFAGINCRACWEKHQEQIKKEKELGHVCRFCGNAWSECSC